jgi:hypothetical protein
MLDSGWVAAVASIVTALVVAVTAVAAFRQLRHGRNANDIVVYLRLVDFMDSPATWIARQNMRTIASKVAADRSYREQLRDPDATPEEFRNVAETLRFLEHISVLVTAGGVAEKLVLAEYAEIFVSIWEVLRPVLVERRIALGPYTGRAFEHLAMRAKIYIDSGRMERDYAALEKDARALEARE